MMKEIINQTTSKTFITKTNVFEGPLDLLLELIEKRKLFVNDISLAQVTDDYIKYVNNLENFDVPHVADFLLIASTLLLIKSKSLLPNLDLTEEEELNIEYLETRLKLYQQMRSLSQYVNELASGDKIFEREYFVDIEPVFSPSGDISIENLFSAIKKLIDRLPKKEKIPSTKVKKVVKLEEIIDNLRDRVQGSFKLSFNEFSKKGKSEKINVIISFLALLELVKQEIILAKQENHFEDIELENNKPTVPKY
ncbi:segregation/condensation protein A [Patescibacteria group bacterium]|nr:segregation/condensation protein A [Patescibacteria group bacterium]